MPTAICENDAAEKDKRRIANNSQRTAPLFLFIACPLNLSVLPTLKREGAPGHCAAEICPRRDSVPNL
jgi:hypothetical protein